MTATEKANELVQKFKPFVYCYRGSGMLTNWEDENVILEMSKKCALIVIDELMKKHCEQIRSDMWKFDKYVQYLEEVKNIVVNMKLEEKNK